MKNRLSLAEWILFIVFIFFIYFSVLLSVVAFGALIGWFIGLFFGDTIYAVTGAAAWRLGAVIAFVIAIINSLANLRRSKK